MPPSSAAVQTFALGSEEPENKEMLPCDEKSGYEVTDTEVIADEQPAEAVNEAPAEEVEESTFAESEAETLTARAATVTGENYRTGWLKHAFRPAQAMAYWFLFRLALL